MSNEQLGLWDLIDDLRELKPIKSTDWKWNMATDYPPTNGLKVFSCFACGGGSTMGYKLAGCEVIGCCEIDKRMNDVYVANHHPKYNYLMDIRDFNKKDDLPEELYNLDILDGSPPCSTFSMAGQREDAWGVKKAFREGQVEQTLDDLLFVFLDTVAKLQPKVFIMENVEGLTLGNAWTYVQNIYAKSREIGYNIKHWLLKGETMGVPQQRHRVFFVGVRNDIDFNLDKVDMSFNYEKLPFGEVREPIGTPLNENAKKDNLFLKAEREDNDIECVCRRLGIKVQGFTDAIISDDVVCKTINAGGMYYSFDRKDRFCDKDFISISTFPQDFDFLGNDCHYLCGMSVPPIMMKRVVTKLIESGIFEVTK